MRRVSLPPSIRDPTTGKTFIAIPAPPLIFAQEADHESRGQLRFIYIEQKDSTSRGLYARGHNPLKENPSVDQWVNKLNIFNTPPDHTPWEGQMTSTSSIGTMTESRSDEFSNPLTDNIQHELPSFTDAVVHQDSELDLSSFASGSSLLRASLPSLSSTLTTSSREVATIAMPSQIPTSFRSPNVMTVSQKRAFSCQPRASSREVIVFEHEVTVSTDGKNRRMSIQVPAQDMAPDMVDMMLQLQELNSFFDDGVKTMDASMLTIDEGKSKLATPSLVVSNSTVTVPISLESFTDIKANVPLAVRRGKHIPAMIGISPPLEGLLDYPDIPTPFRGSPTVEVQNFDIPKVPGPIPKTQMSTKEMIADLRARMDSFGPRSPTSLGEPMQAAFDEAEEWLSSEVTLNEQRCDIGGDEDTSCMRQCEDTETHEGDAPILDLPPSGKSAAESLGTNDHLAPRRSIPLIRREPPFVSGYEANLKHSPNTTQALLPLTRRAPTLCQPQCVIKPPSVNLKDWDAKKKMRGTNTLARFRKINPMNPGLAAPMKKVHFSTVPPVTIPQDASIKGTQPTNPRIPSPLRQSFGPVTRSLGAPSTSNMSGRKGSLMRRMTTGSVLVGGPFTKTSMPPVDDESDTNTCELRTGDLVGKGKENRPNRIIPRLESREAADNILRGKVDRGEDRKLSKPRKSPLQAMFGRFKV